MKYLILAAAFFCCQFTNGQNLVSNGNFETFTTCPPTWDHIYDATGWKTATDATPDYYNACSLGIMSVPHNTMGWQMAASGDGYSGIYTYSDLNPWREYMSGDMDTLELGASYRVSMKVSLADTCSYATKGLGVYFYKEAPSDDTNTIFKLDCIPQIDYSSYGLITDTTNWTTLVDTFVADSAYRNFIIGFFYDTIGRLSKPYPNNMDRSYYYIDDVSVVKIIPAGVKTFVSIYCTLSPNPFTTSTSLTFSNPQRKEHRLSIYNIQGRLMQKIANINTDEVRIERNDLSPGCYFYELKSEDGATAKGKLFVQ